jgi:predicted phage terminase large subunit-like protein
MGDRLDDPKTGGRLVVAHRVHARDLSQHVLEQGGYVHLCLPAEYEKDRACWTKVKPRKGNLPCKDGKYKWDVRTREGELMDPDRMDKRSISELKKRLGSYAWPARLQQRPSVRAGGMIKLDWFPRYRTPPADFIQIIQSWDTANKGGQSNAYSVCHTFLRTDKASYLVHTFRERLSIPDLKRTVINHSITKFGMAHAVLIEEAASGIGLIQQLQADEESSVPVIAMRPETDKITRMDVETPAIEAGLVLLPQEADWLTEFESEMRDFPASRFKDQADALSQYLKWLRESYGTAIDWSIY